ncbi:MAG: hypothetical protein AAF432_06895 [Planctomycetota bacterium]
MTDRTDHASPSAGMQWIVGGLLIVAVAVVTLITVSKSSIVETPAPVRFIQDDRPFGRLASDGVVATITVAGLTVERPLAAAGFSLQPGESLDERLPAGAMELSLRTIIAPGRSTEARVGARIRGGSFILTHRGDVLLSDAAGDEPVERLTIAPLRRFGPDDEILTYDITWDGIQPIEFRPLWRPADQFSGVADGPALRLPADGGALLGHAAAEGLALMQQHRCTACHATSEPALAALLDIPDAPMLSDVGSRLRPGWLDRWLASPHDMVDGTPMPSVLHGRDESARMQLVHFLMSQSGSPDEGVERVDDAASLRRTGEILFHDVGCIACHGPRTGLEDLPGGRSNAGALRRRYAAIPDLASKMSRDTLTAFLADPVRWHPDGRMPDMQLTDIEARALAAYLYDDSVDVGDDASWSTDPIAVAAGARHFVSTGCINCHAMDNVSNTAPAIIAPPLESLVNAGMEGCLSEAPVSGAPYFGFSRFERDAIRNAIDATHERTLTPTPHLELGMTMRRLNCQACHQYHGVSGPEPAITRYFNSSHEADLGDESRIPPDLTDVGGRLTTSWMHATLVDGAISRPWMAARMPQFGEDNVGDLPELFACMSGHPASTHDIEITARASAVGRELVGSNGMNCIQCHNVAGYPATGSPGPDLAQATQRLRHDAFSRWLYDPSLLRTGTRMPSFFVHGRSAFRDYLGGDAEAQIDAIWAYLDQGENLQLPEGLQPVGGMILSADEKPILFRTFMQDAGVRAIACGFPEGVHAAYDADRAQLALVWTGEFLNASSAWANRGGAETNPPAINWNVGDVATLRLAGTEDTTVRFRGYTVDEAGMPSFRSVLMADGTRVDVTERLIPVVRDDRQAMEQRIDLRGAPGTQVIVVVDNRTCRLPENLSDATEITVTLDESGTALVVMEVTW